tara:strand:+ start:43 stop:738 length:696 start_codon:yes stop_codon:yes gene_type:complete
MFGLFGGAPSAADIRRADRRNIVSKMSQYGKTGYGSNVYLDSRSLDRLPGDFLADQTGYVFSDSPYAPSSEYESAGYQGTGSSGSGRGARATNFYLFKKKPDRIAEVRAEQQRLAGIQQETFNKQQADIAEQLKIIQSEKSAVAKAQEDYSNMLIAEAQRKKEAEEQAKRNLQSQRANQAMAGLSGNLQIQPAGSTPRTGGTQQFRRRTIQQGTASPYKGLSTIQSGMVNV